MNYVTVFDVTQSGYGFYWPVILGVPFAGLGLFALLAKRNKGQAPLYFFLILGGSFAAICIVGTLLLIGLGRYRLTSALRHGRCQVVEGVVEDFRPVPLDGRGEESFAVAGHRFRYSDYQFLPGFHQSQFRGGPIREGLQVKIYHVDGDIARLEIAR